MPTMPKHPGARARRNKSSTAAMLTTREAEDVEVPDLPVHTKADEGVDWHENAKAMWTDLWSSPMSSEYDDSDIHQMFILLRLVDQFWSTNSTSGMKELAAEIRLTGQQFGVNPLARRRLEWQIQENEEKADRGKRRRAREDPPTAPPSGAADPRAILRVAPGPR
jgi:hypothetical protein